MTSQPHLRAINSNQSTHHEELKFSLFPLLPKELRLKIWRHTLQRGRIIHLCLNNQRRKTATQAGENPESTRNGERYFTIVDGSQLLSKLLRVNKESRDEALVFFRVHIPCSFRSTRKGPTGHGKLHMNPEWDFLHISAEWFAKDTLVSFLYHLKTIHDPRHVGLLNLAVDGNGLNGTDLYQLPFSDLDSEVRSAFVETLTQLREVWFVSTPRVGRQIVGTLGLSGLPTSDTIFNRSLPVITTVPSFERLHRDPRPIAQDLKALTGLAHSRDVLQLWLQLLKRWRIVPLGIEYRFLLAFDPPIGGDQISDRTSAKTWLQKDDDKWNGRAPDDGFIKGTEVKWPVGAENEKYINEDLAKAVRPAFGFWLFPVDALGYIDEEGLWRDQQSQLREEAFVDMTAYWPELALTSLP